MSQRKYALDILQDTGLRCSSRQISNGTIHKTTLWRVINGSSQIQATCGTTDIPHGYSAWHSILGSDPKSIYTDPRKTSLGCCNSSPKVHQRVTRTRIAIAIRKQSNINNLLRLRLGRLSDNSEISIWVLHFSWFFYYLIEVKKNRQTCHVTCQLNFSGTIKRHYI